MATGMQCGLVVRDHLECRSLLVGLLPFRGLARKVRLDGRLTLCAAHVPILLQHFGCLLVLPLPFVKGRPVVMSKYRTVGLGAKFWLPGANP